MTISSGAAAPIPTAGVASAPTTTAPASAPAPDLATALAQLAHAVDALAAVVAAMQPGATTASAQAEAGASVAGGGAPQQASGGCGCGGAAAAAAGAAPVATPAGATSPIQSSPAVPNLLANATAAAAASPPATVGAVEDAGRGHRGHGNRGHRAHHGRTDGIAELVHHGGHADGIASLIDQGAAGAAAGAAQSGAAGGAHVLDRADLTIKGRRMDDAQRRNIQTVLEVGEQMGADRRVLATAVATMIQESTARNDASVDSKDLDSLGLFQQRPSAGWGTREQIARPEYAARKFFEKAIPNAAQHPEWRNTQLAQSVQISAFPDAYAQWHDESMAIVDDYLG